MTRRSMSPARRKRILAAHNNRCAIAGCEVPGPYELDHIQALARGGGDEDDNIRPLCRRHHKVKTFGGFASKLGADLYEIAKPKRIAKKRAQPRGQGSIKSRGFSKRYRKKMDGTVAER